MQKQHAPNPFFRPTLPLSVAALVLAFSACNCPGGGTDRVDPDLIAHPVALSFETCPTLDENRQPVADVFPVQQTFKLDNLANAGAPITFNITGAGAERFKLVDPPESIGSFGSVDVTVEFTPVAQGDALATLEIDDGVEDTEVVRVTLVGTGTNLPAQPTMKFSFETAVGTNEFQECVEGLLCQVVFPDTYFGENASLKMKIRNVGCPALKVNSLTIEPSTFGGGTSIAYSLDQPTVPPTVGNPTLLTIADGTQELDAAVRFLPDNDGSGDGQRYAIFTIQTNSTQVFDQGEAPGTMRVLLAGRGSEPAVYATPSFCDFTDDADLCGGNKVPTTGNDRMAVFQVINGGDSEVVIDTIRFAEPFSGRFSFGEQNPQGMTLQAGQSAPLQVHYNDASTYVIDHIEITAMRPGGTPGDAGFARIRISGGVQPALTTAPRIELSFSDVPDRVAVKPLDICNEAGAGDLVLQSVQIVQGAFNGTTGFRLNSAPAANAVLRGGECVTTEVQLTRPVSGGLQAGTLEIRSNDLAYAAGYRVTLLSELPLDQLPVAHIEGPGGETTAFSVSLASLNPKRMTLIGSKSYDPPGNGPVAEYRWYIARQPNGPGAAATLTDLETPAGPDIQGMKSADYAEVNLNFAPDRVGEYRIVLTVFDSAGQKSASDGEIRILVTQ